MHRNYKYDRIEDCEKILYKKPMFIDELKKELDYKTTHATVYCIRRLRYKNSNIKMFRCFDNTIIYYDSNEQILKAYDKIRNKYKHKFEHGIPWQTLKPLIKPTHLYKTRNDYL
jgi:hypothetical protein